MGKIVIDEEKLKEIGEMCSKLAQSINEAINKTDRLLREGNFDLEPEVVAALKEQEKQMAARFHNTKDSGEMTMEELEEITAGYPKPIDDQEFQMHR